MPWYIWVCHGIFEYAMVLQVRWSIWLTEGPVHANCPRLTTSLGFYSQTSWKWTLLFYSCLLQGRWVRGVGRWQIPWQDLFPGCWGLTFLPTWTWGGIGGWDENWYQWLSLDEAGVGSNHKATVGHHHHSQHTSQEVKSARLESRPHSCPHHCCGHNTRQHQPWHQQPTSLLPQKYSRCFNWVCCDVYVYNIDILCILYCTILHFFC